MEKNDKYIPALRHDWLTPLYDPLLRWIMREEKFKRRLIAQADIQPGHHVLDLGCGTATLTVLIKRTHPAAEVVGVDGDPKVLDIGRAKAAKASVGIQLDHGLADQLPYPDQSFDRVLSSLVLHHLTGENKRRAAREVFRVLRPGGELHVVDFGKPHTVWSKLISSLTSRLEEAADNVAGRLPEIFREAGFDLIEETGSHSTVFGSLSFYRARKPG
ncbi:MAG TPA: methyltransferase domain-containing protein [Anaerolineae bacterium]|nr:methyltransferase domain-containing protein [Anaerolineae bacterium]